MSPGATTHPSPIVPDISALRSAHVRVPASTSNLGAGFDCLGLALDLYLEASWLPATGPLEVSFNGTLSGLTGRDLLSETLRSAMAERGVEAGGRLDITSEIPIGRGLGSSATAVIAALALAAAALGEPLDLIAALVRTSAIEGHADNAAPSLLGGLVGVARDAAEIPVAFRLPISGALAFTWAAPAIEVTTADARAALPAQIGHNAAARALSRTAALLNGLAQADPELIRIGLADELHVPWRLPLIPGGAAALNAAVDAGAWAATISGSGSGLIAVGPPGCESEVAAAMAVALRDAARNDAELAGVIARAVTPDPLGAQILPA